MRIACCGMIMCDIPLFPVPLDIMQSQYIHIEPVTMTTGGDALNVAKTLKILGAPEVLLAGYIGTDIHGDVVVAHAQSHGVDTSYLKRDDKYATPTSYHLVDPNGKTHTLGYIPNYDVLDDTDFPDSALDGAGIVYYGSLMTFPEMDYGGIARLFKRAHARGAVTVMDSAIDRSDPDGPEEFKKVESGLYETDIFLPSISEISYLTGTKDPKENARLMERFGMKVFGIKLGPKGCYLTDFKDEYYIAAFAEFKPLDTVGAGDSFVGSFLRGYSMGWNLPECGALASLVSSFNVTKLGATGGVPDFKTASDYLSAHPANITKNAY